MPVPQKRKVITIPDEDEDELVVLDHNPRPKLQRTNSNRPSIPLKRPSALGIPSTPEGQNDLGTTTPSSFANFSWSAPSSRNPRSRFSSSGRSRRGSLVNLQEPPFSPSSTSGPSVSRIGSKARQIVLWEDEVGELSSSPNGNEDISSRDAASQTVHARAGNRLELGSMTDIEEQHNPDPYADAIELTDDETDEDSSSVPDLDPYANAIELSDDEHFPVPSATKRPKPRRKSTIYPQRNPPIIYPLITKSEHILPNNLRLAAGKFIELNDGDFLRIATIIANSITEKVTLRGHRLMRTSAFNGMLEKKLNELCYFYEVDLNDPRPFLEQSLHEVELDEMKRIRNVRTTNQKFPLDRNLDPGKYDLPQVAAEQGGLTVRWKYTCKYASAREKRKNDFAEKVFERIGAREMRSAAVSDEGMRREWRGETIAGGAHLPRLRCTSEPSNCGTTLVDLFSPSPTLGAKDDDIIPASRRQFKINETSRRDSCALVETNDCCLQNDGVEEARARIQTMSLDNLEPAPVDLTLTENVEAIGPSQWPNGRRKEKKCPVLGNMPEEQHFQVKPIRERVPSKCPRHAVDTSAQPLPAYIDLISGSEVGSTATPKKVPSQTYTYGDAFCGCGGTTRGAVMAGLKVKWGFDGWEVACKTWRENFPNSLCYQLRSHEFVNLARRSAEHGSPDIMKVDILHLSPPCQFFSDAHTINGKDDDMNSASLFAVREVIAASRPRVVTIEQTFGITRPRFIWYLAALIQMCTSLGFSVRWAVVPLAQWGLPQRRRRLIMIASCPGEILPRIPSPTYDEDGKDGLKPYNTVNATIRRISPNDPHNNPEDARFRDNRIRSPWDGNSVLPRTMTTSGGQNYHPNGRRDFTRAEYAAVQGFPETHRFLVGTSYIKKQIGNAVPPCVAKVMFESIKRDLDDADGMAGGVEVVLIE